jgi:hypothetical protein
MSKIVLVMRNHETGNSVHELTMLLSPLSHGSYANPCCRLSTSLNLLQLLRASEVVFVRCIMKMDRQKFKQRCAIKFCSSNFRLKCGKGVDRSSIDIENDQ